MCGKIGDDATNIDTHRRGGARTPFPFGKRDEREPKLPKYNGRKNRFQLVGVGSLFTTINLWHIEKSNLPPICLVDLGDGESGTTAVIIWPQHGPVAGNEWVSSWKVPDARLHTTETETETEHDGTLRHHLRSTSGLLLWLDLPVACCLKSCIHAASDVKPSSQGK